MLVSGAPGSGKTTLARPLARALGFALISKDDIKEPMFDTLGAVAGDLTQSRKFGAASWEVLWSLARHSPRLVLEANFHPDSDDERSRIAALPAEITEVFCRCPAAEAARRFNVRASTLERHKAHAAVSEITEDDVIRLFGKPIGIGPVIEVDTTLPTDIDGVVRAVTRTWEPL